MTKRGALTEIDRDILEHLAQAGPSTTSEITEDLTDRRVYQRLVRLHRLGHVDRMQLGNSTPVLWAAR